MASVIGAAALANQALAQEGAAQPAADTHSFGRVITLAQERAQSPDKPDQFRLSGAYADLTYDQYRGIRFRRSADPIQSSHSQFGLDLLPPKGEDAVHNGTVSGDQYTGVAKQSGEYRVRVYLLNAAAKRGETAKYHLKISTGQ